jgi:hypothetical protein
MENTTQELMIKVSCWKLEAYSQLIEEYAYKNRAKIVQKLLELKHQLEEKLGLNRSLQAQYGCQNPATNGKSLGGLNYAQNQGK